MFGERKYVLTAALCIVALSMPGIAHADFGYITQWGTQGNGRDQLDIPMDVAVSDDDWVYVADEHNNRIVKYETDGTWHWSWSETGGNDQLRSPFSVAANSLVYVTNTESSLIEKFNRGGIHFRTWGEVGRAEGQILAPMGISVDASNRVFVSDTGNNRIQKFSSIGGHVGTWGEEGGRKGEFKTPTGIANDEQGNVYVADTGNDRIQIFDGDGRYLGNIKNWGPIGNQDSLSNPFDVAVDEQGNIYVADTGNHRVLQFTGAGSLIREWGGQGRGPGEFVSPTGLDLDSRGNLYIADAGNHRIQKFGKREDGNEGGDGGPGAPGDGDPAPGGATGSGVWLGAPNQGGGATGQAESSLKLGINLLQITSTGKAVFELDCTGTERCDGTMTLSSLSGYRIKKRSKKSRSWVAKKARSKKSKSCTKKRRKRSLCRGTSLGKSKFSVEAGKSIKIRVRLSKKKRRLLSSWARRHRKLRLRATAKMGSQVSGKVTVKRSFTLMKSKKKKKKKKKRR